MPKFLETRKRAARRHIPPELDVLFAIVNDGQFDFDEVGGFDADRFSTHAALRAALDFEMRCLLGSQQARARYDSIGDLSKHPGIKRSLLAGEWTDDGRRRGSSADDIRKHAGATPRDSEDPAAAAARHAAAELAHRLLIDFFEHRKIVGYLCLARCQCGRWFLSLHDRQAYHSAACASSARSRQFRAARLDYTSPARLQR